jgi:tetratricopeptide (TPR) repeat protein
MSGIIGLIEEDTGRVLFFNAEHPWMVLYRDEKASFAEDESRVGRKLGTVGFAQVYIKDIQLRPGDILFMGSDGKDDVKIGIDPETGNRVINEDEKAFLRHVEYNKGNIFRVANAVETSGELTDDFTMIRIGFLEDFESRKEELSQAGITIGDDGNILVENSNIGTGVENDKVKMFREMDEHKAEAYRLYKEGKFKDALTILESLKGNYNRYEDNFQVLYLLGHCLVKLQRYDESIQVWEEALTFRPDNEKLIRNIQSIKHYIRNPSE